MKNNSTKRLFSSIFAAIALLLLLPQVNAEPYLGKLGKYISAEGVFPADINILVFTPEMRRLADKLQTSIDAQPQWFEQYSKATPPGQPLPYHSNLGLSEAEYRQVLEGQERQVLESNGTTQVSVVFRSDETIRITGLPGDAPFNGLLYEPVSDSIISSYGTMQKSQAADGTLGADNIMAWSGRLWSTSHDSPDRKLNVVYIVGELKNQPKSVMIHEITGLVNQQPIDYHYVLIWDKK